MDISIKGIQFLSFLTFSSDHIQLCLLYKSDLCISTAGKKKELLEIKTFKRQYLPHYQSDNGVNGTFVDQAMSSLH